MALKNIPRTPIDGMGGVRYYLVTPFEVGGIVIDDTTGLATFRAEKSAGSDPAVEPAVTAWKPEWKRFDVKKESSNATLTWTGNPATGSGFEEQIATMIFSKDTPEKRINVAELAKTETCVIEVDYNGNAKVLGASNGCDLTSNVTTTGTAGGDLNGCTVTLRAIEPVPAPFIATIPIETAD